MGGPAEDARPSSRAWRRLNVPTAHARGDGCCGMKVRAARAAPRPSSHGEILLRRSGCLKAAKRRLRRWPGGARPALTRPDRRSPLASER